MIERVLPIVMGIKIKSKYEGICKASRRPIKVGDEIIWCKGVGSFLVDECIWSDPRADVAKMQTPDGKIIGK